MWLVVLRAGYESENYLRVWARAGEISRSLLAQYGGVCLLQRISLGASARLALGL
mgnify:CR=1 FL=1